MKIFNPPIATRHSRELSKIVAIPEDWDEDAVTQAKNELTARGVDYSDLVTREKFLQDRQENMERAKRAKESFSIFDFLDSPLFTLFEILISWELKKDGFLRKARQQRTFRIIIFVVFIAIYTFSLFSSEI
ncbi:MAG: hypothetical protein EOO42_12520 [Flavobacteriales bacterium]|nr:MAG: hypothetical protein EOO42_12520 [Flavobacteriales bacterium]